MGLVFKKKPKFKNFLDEKKSSFTLIELLVVVAIIGILYAITASLVTPARKRARDVVFKQIASSIDSAAVICCNIIGSPSINPNPGNIDVCVLDIDSRYPDATQIGSVVVNSDCTNNRFKITLFPGTSNTGNCTQATCTEEGCTYVGC
jgi:prepilin-type N-terminal cleavage/methylation domain-containing protein